MIQRQKKTKILIADDEPNALYTLEMLLSQEPFEIIFAQSGQAALDGVAADPPDLILLDVMMPDMTGFEVCQKLKSDIRYQHIPIILVTALDRREDLVRGLDAGADEYITKPVHGLELRARVRSMLRIKKQYDDLQEAMELQEEMANMIMHDMRNPISTLMLYTNLIVHYQHQSKPLGGIAEKLTYQARRLNSFLGDLLLLAKIRSGKVVLQLAPVDLVSLLKNVVGDNQPLADTEEIAIQLELPAESKEFSLDENLMLRVLDNLISNALKFSPPNSTIKLRLTYANDEISPVNEQTRFRLEVCDEGPGIPQEYRERIFDRFEIMEIKKEGILQLGLGLAMCKMAVEAHGGRIFVKDNFPIGANFTIDI